MSREEHDETIASISKGVAYIIKWSKIILPIIGVICAGIIWIGLKAISLNEWNNSLVKQPQFAKEVSNRVSGDSTLNAKIDSLPQLRFSGVTQRKVGNEIIESRVN